MGFYAVRGKMHLCKQRCMEKRNYSTRRPQLKVPA